MKKAISMLLAMILLAGSCVAGASAISIAPQNLNWVESKQAVTILAGDVAAWRWAVDSNNIVGTLTDAKDEEAYIKAITKAFADYDGFCEAISVTFDADAPLDNFLAQFYTIIAGTVDQENAGTAATALEKAYLDGSLQAAARNSITAAQAAVKRYYGTTVADNLNVYMEDLKEMLALEAQVTYLTGHNVFYAGDKNSVDAYDLATEKYGDAKDVYDGFSAPADATYATMAAQVRIYIRAQQAYIAALKAVSHVELTDRELEEYASMVEQLLYFAENTDDYVKVTELFNDPVAADEDNDIAADPGDYREGKDSGTLAADIATAMEAILKDQDYKDAIALLKEAIDFESASFYDVGTLRLVLQRISDDVTIAIKGNVTEAAYNDYVAYLAAQSSLEKDYFTASDSDQLKAEIADSAYATGIAPAGMSAEEFAAFRLSYIAYLEAEKALDEAFGEDSVATLAEKTKAIKAFLAAKKDMLSRIGIPKSANALGMPNTVTIYRREGETWFTDNYDTENVFWGASNADLFTINESTGELYFKFAASSLIKGETTVYAYNAAGELIDQSTVTVTWVWWKWVLVVVAFGWIYL